MIDENIRVRWAFAGVAQQRRALGWRWAAACAVLIVAGFADAWWGWPLPNELLLVAGVFTYGRAVGHLDWADGYTSAHLERMAAEHRKDGQK